MLKVVTAPSEPAPGGMGPTAGEIRVVEKHSARGKTPATTLLVSLGRVSECNLEMFRRAGGAAGRWMNEKNVRRAVVDVASVDEAHIDGGLQGFCEGLTLGAFCFDRRKSQKKNSPTASVDLLTKRRSATLARKINRTLTVSEAVNLTREWAHEPPNILNPATLAGRIARLARASKLRCRVYNDKQLARMKAGALLSVGVASKTPSRLIVLEYAGRPGKARAKPVVLVGKAITFDTGGYSLKDKKGIVGMKYDKCGGVAVVGTMQAVAALKLKTPVVGVIAAAENMISGKAYRPNDIITTMSGRTVEIISTDAEGRMVLADALTYSQRHYKPRAIIDLATLTGGVMIALGAVRAGLFANDDQLAAALTAAGERVHERLWRLPLDDDYLELIKGDDSDLKNSGGRGAHPVVGGIFLKQFVDPKVPWAHLDIAGTATCEKDQPYCPKGATGFGVRLLVDYLEHL